MSILQERIKERRLASGLTLSEVAELIGVKEATVQRYESGEIKNIKHTTIVKLSEIFRCTPQYLMGWSDMLIEPNSLESLNLFLQPELFKRDSDIKLLASYQKLNDEGKSKLADYSEDLTRIDKYTK